MKAIEQFQAIVDLVWDEDKAFIKDCFKGGCFTGLHEDGTFEKVEDIFIEALSEKHNAEKEAAKLSRQAKKVQK